MIKTYIIPMSEREAIEKAVAKYRRKADAYGCEFSVKLGEPYAKERKVWETAYDGHGFPFKKEIGTQLVEVFDVEISDDLIRKSGYEVIAKLEHLEGGNVVSVFSDEDKAEWREMKPRCEHCGGNHGQKVTFIVRHEDGTELQVGRTCLKDYCGIDPKRIALIKQLCDLFLDEDIDHRDFIRRPAVPAFSVVEVLALAIRVINAQGYVKSGEWNSNREMIYKHFVDGNKPSEKEMGVASELAEKIGAMGHETASAWMLDSALALIRSGYCKESHFGYLAYAPIAYKRYEEKLERDARREAEKEAERCKSEFVGNVGERIVIEVAEMNLLTSWENAYGMTYLYKIIDVAGNVFVWFASKHMNSVGKIKATIKDHSERDGVKQTVVTRCMAA